VTAGTLVARAGVAAAAALAAALAGLAPSGEARTPTSKPPLRVLFIGNSQTSTNDLPAFVQAIARAAGHAPVETRMIAPSAVGLAWHWRVGIAPAVVRYWRWDAVVFQQGPSVLPGARESLCAGASAFARAARASGARPYLLMVWPRRGRPVEEVASAYAAASAAARAPLLPAGVAWTWARMREPGLWLHDADGVHPGRLGTYLTALVVYAGLRRIPPVAPTSLEVAGRPFGVPPDVALTLREAARDALRTQLPAASCGPS
jgi:hypothetical protein